MMITTFLEKTVICASFLFWTKVNLKDSLYDFDSIAYDCCIICHPEVIYSQKCNILRVIFLQNQEKVTFN